MRAAAYLLGLMFLLQPGRARAQAWTPEARTLSLDFMYTFAIANRAENQDVSIVHHVFTPDVGYAITDRFAVSASLPLVVLKARTPNPHGSWDDDNYHSTATDLRLTARYMIPFHFIAVTPQLGASAAVRDYEVNGNAAAGRDLKGAYIGLNVGFDLDDYVPRSTFHLSYELALMQHYSRAGPDVEARDQNYSQMSMQFGHSVGNFHFHAGVDYHYYHGGVTIAELPGVTAAERMNHEPILRERILLAGGGVGYDLDEHTSLYAVARLFVHGEDSSNWSLFVVRATRDFDL